MFKNLKTRYQKFRRNKRVSNVKDAARQLLVSSGVVLVDNSTITGTLPELVQKYGVYPQSEEYINQTISTILKHHLDGKLINGSNIQKIVIPENNFLNGVQNYKLYVKELAFKLNVTEEEAMNRMQDYFTRGNSIEIIRVGSLGIAEKTFNGAVRIGIYGSLQTVLTDSYLSGLHGAKIMAKHPIIAISLPTLFGFGFQTLNTLLPPQSLASNITLLASDIFYLPAWFIETTYNHAIAKNIARIGGPFIGLNITGPPSGGWEAGKYLVTNPKFNEKVAKAIQVALKWIPGIP